MAMSDYQAMLYGVSNHTSRSQFLHRLSTHSSSTSGSSRKAPARVTKQSSAGNSPHYVQRRRTTQPHANRTYPHVAQGTPYQTREQRLQHYYSSQDPLQCTRPMSWHPGSDTLYAAGAQKPASEPQLGSTITGIENLAVSCTPASSVQQSIEEAFSMGYGFQVSRPPTVYDRSPSDMEGYGNITTAAEPMSMSYSSYNNANQQQPSYVTQSHPYGSYQQQGDHLHQPHQPGPSFTLPFQPQQPNSDYMLTDYCVPSPEKFSLNTARNLRKGEKELSGIGLYDNEDDSFVSTLNSALSGQYPSRDSVGKGLTLEEPFAPNDEDDDDDDEEDEGYSSEEAEEVEEVLPIKDVTMDKTQTQFYPTYSDLSNQSFFFNDDDQYPTEDQYANYLAYSQGLSDNQPKPQAVGSTNNFLWL